MNIANEIKIYQFEIHISMILYIDAFREETEHRVHEISEKFHILFHSFKVRILCMLNKKTPHFCGGFLFLCYSFCGFTKKELFLSDFTCSLPNIGTLIALYKSIKVSTRGRFINE